MKKIKNNGSYQPEVIKPVIRITDELPPYWLVYQKSRDQEYTILCNLEIKGRTGRKAPRGIETTVYYNRKFLQMDPAAEDLIREYLTPVTYELPDDDQEEDIAMRPIMKQFGKTAAWELFDARRDIQLQVRDWAYTQLAQMELREPAAYIWADYEEVNFHLPDDFYLISKGLEQSLYDSGLKYDNWMYVIFIAGYLKGSRETDQAVPELVRETFQGPILSNHNVRL